LLRHTDEWVGLLVLACAALFVFAVLEAGLLGAWFRPVAHLRVVLPQEGSFGLSAGDDIELLGTRVGTVQRVVLDQTQRMYAETNLDESVTGFIRRDSTAEIKKRFGVAGATYLDITRGTGAPLDWTYAVIEATSERDATETVSALIGEVRGLVLPLMEDTGRAVHALAATMETIQQGHGDVGRLLKDEALTDRAAALLGRLDEAVNQANAAIGELRATIADLHAATATGQDSVPVLLRRADDALASLQSATRDLAKTTPALPSIARNVAGSTAELPALLTQTQQSMAELERALTQLRHTWPLSGAATPDARRLPTTEIKP
jgi:phospholipid/cholesterol/gamma-HCH transport system substrate-binding protein